MASNKKIDDEFLIMLSAYLDGELTDSQSQRVERRLAEDAEARAWLADFRKVSEMVGSLPREQAPGTLTDQVLSEMERGILLDNRDIQSHAAGRNHLLARRIVAAAAMVVLVCSVGVIIINILSRSPGGAESGGHNQAVEPMIVISKTPPSAREMAESPSQDDRSASGQAAAPLSAMAPVEAVGIAHYNPVQLVLNASAGLEAESAKMNGMLAYHGIDQSVQSAVDLGQRQFAFVCTAGQLRKLFESIQENEPQRLDLIISGFECSSQVVISPVNGEQLMAIAAQSEPKQQCILALAQRWGRLVPVEKDVSLPGQAMATEQLPPWLSEAIVRSQPEMTDIRALGHIKTDGGAAGQTAAVKAKVEANTVSEGLSVDASAAQPITQPAPQLATQPAATDVAGESGVLPGVSAGSDETRYIGVVLTIRVKSAGAIERIDAGSNGSPSVPGK